MHVHNIWKKKKNSQKKEEKLPKDKGAMFLAPNPKTCTQYKKTKKLTIINKEWDKPCTCI
jgi:hypothetical protein